MDKSTYDGLVAQASAIMFRKAQDYNNPKAVQLHDYFPFKDKSYVQMLHVKTQRLISLAESDSAPNFESTKDSVLDLINYAVIYLDYLENGDA